MLIRPSHGTSWRAHTSPLLGTDDDERPAALKADFHRREQTSDDLLPAVTSVHKLADNVVCIAQIEVAVANIVSQHAYEFRHLGELLFRHRGFSYFLGDHAGTHLHG